ncbi:MAG: GNAT family N-acetyltransferase [Cyanobacteria bacterium SIG30]|nr:GNAT family N-acetyltransferase [Cyanobacteria bacterium SIG30]
MIQRIGAKNTFSYVVQKYQDDIQDTICQKNNFKIQNSNKILDYYNVSNIAFLGKKYKPSENFELITKKNVDDILPLYKKYQEGMNQNVDENKLRKYLLTVLDNKDKMFVIKKDNEPSGFIHFSTSYSTIDMCPFVTIQSVFVSKEKRGMGISRELVNELKKWTEFNNYKGIFVKTLAKNEVSMSMYEKMNFKNENGKYGTFFWPNEKILNYEKGYVNTKS